MCQVSSKEIPEDGRYSTQCLKLSGSQPKPRDNQIRKCLNLEKTFTTTQGDKVSL